MTGARVVIVAEAGASHEQSYARSMAVIDAARQAGADAVKFSAFLPKQMTVDSDEPPFVITGGPWDGRTLFSLYRQSALPYDWIPDLKTAAQAAGLDFVLSVYHPETVAMLEKWAVRTVKIASFEVGYRTLLHSIAQEEYIRNVIVSTGGATLEEIAAAVDILKDKSLVLLHCISAYPAQPSQMNLLTIGDLGQRFDVPVGLSDHSQGITAPVAAVTLGAAVIEKHIKLDDNGLDSSFAVYPDRFAAMVRACRMAEEMLGDVRYDGVKTFHRTEINGSMLRKVWQ